MKKITWAVVGAVAVVLLVGTVRAGSIEVDFDPKAGFERYKTWAWAPGHDQGHRGVFVDPTMRQRVETALAQQLRSAGLVPADQGAVADLLVRYRGDIGVGNTVTTSAGSYENWADPGYATIQFSEQTATLFVDLIDSATNTLAWRLYVDQNYGGPNDPPNKLRRALEKGFSKYPPSASERARKQRALEKRSGAR